MSNNCGAFCSFCGKCGRRATQTFAAKPPDVPPPGVMLHSEQHEEGEEAEEADKPAETAKPTEATPSEEE